MTRRPARTVVRALSGAFVALLATGGLAVAGALPAPVQDAVSDAAGEVGVDLPDVEEPEADAPEAEEEADGAEHPDNHGKEVSELARTTELEGCEKGRAVSALASGREVDERKPCPHADDAEADEDTGEDTDVDDPDADVDEGGAGAPEQGEARGSGHGRSDDAPGHVRHD